MTYCSVTANDRTFQSATNTASIEQAYLDEISRRVRRMRGLIRRTVGYENDALSLSANAREEDQFEFQSDQGRIQSFTAWLKQALQDELVGGTGTGVEVGGHWSGVFTRRAYLAGWDQATGLLMQRGVSADQLDPEDILNLPKPQTQLRDLYRRNFQQWPDVSREIAGELQETLTRGLAEGWNPRKMASKLNQELDSIERSRLATIARSEIINSHSMATLDRYEDAGQDIVSHQEWKTAEDDRVCPICKALEGREFTVQEMRDTMFEMDDVDFQVRLRPPAHPNCRCSLLPVIGGTPPTTPLSERLPDEPVEQEANARAVA